MLKLIAFGKYRSLELAIDDAGNAWQRNLGRGPLTPVPHEAYDSDWSFIWDRKLGRACEIWGKSYTEMMPLEEFLIKIELTDEHELYK